MSHEIQAVFAIAVRDVLRFLRDRPRIFASLIFPFIFIAVLGLSFQSSFGADLPYNYLTFVFTGVFAQTLFQSTASGVISIIEDRENNFTQEIFVSPISRYTIIIGKIVGETFVSFAQIIGVIFFGVVLGVGFTFDALMLMFPAGVVAALFGGAFGVLVLSNLNTQRAANQIFPFLILPQFFLAGIFNPVNDLPLFLIILSRIAPMTYAVDFVRNAFYVGNPDLPYVTIYSAGVDFLIISVLFIIFISVGTFLFVRGERNR